MSPPPADPKAAVRKLLRARRRALTPAERAEKSRAAARAVAGLAPFAHGKRVALFLSFDGETDTKPLIAAARRRGVILYTPVVADRRRGIIRFHRLGEDTRAGTYGIQVPRRKTAPLPARWFDLIVVPLVGIDAAGRRLGMGGGYYDRALAFRRPRTTWKGPRLVGYAFDCQRADVVHPQTWDLRMDALATESGIQLFT
jgi:5-formyltetrahydrofolate cyclo-ligase